MAQDTIADVPVPDVPPKAAPENVVLRAQPRPVTRLNRRMLAALAGGLSVAVLSALMWSLQPHRHGASESAELYNVDRVSRSEGLNQLPSDYSKMPPALPPDVPQLGAPLPGDLRPAILKAEQQTQGYGYQQPGHDPAKVARVARLKEAEEAAVSLVCFRSGGQTVASAASTASAQAAPAAGLAANTAFDPMAAGPASAAAQPANPPPRRTAKIRRRRFCPKPVLCKPAIPVRCKCLARRIR